MNRLHVIPIVIGVILLTVGVLSTGSFGFQETKPIVGEIPTPINPPAEEQNKAAQRMEDEAKRSGEPIHIKGWHTRGSTIVIKGAEVKLPDDVWTDGMIATALCPTFDCISYPAWILRRGEGKDTDAWAFISIETGEIEYRDDQGEAKRKEAMEAFRFLEDIVGKLGDELK